MSDISNTDELRKRAMTELVIGGTEGMIERQEAQGQREIVNSDRLPVAGSNNPEFEKLGFTFGDPDPDDPIFRTATLPEGWKREGSDHSMWSYLVDPDGYQRVSIFYKGAFYDRSAHMNLNLVPCTRAQSEAYTEVEKAIGQDRDHNYDEPFLMMGESRREGPDYIYHYKGCKGRIKAEAEIQSGERASSFDTDGRIVEVRVAPDGSIVSVEKK